MSGKFKFSWQQLAAAAMLMAAVATTGCQQLRYEPQLVLRQLRRERTQPYYHSDTTGEIVVKHPHRICPTAGPAYFGLEPTCWNPWPADWTGCPHPGFCDCPTSGVSGPTPADPPSPQAEPLPATPAEPPGNQDRTGSVLVPAPDAAAMVQPPRAPSDPAWIAPRIVAFTPQLASNHRPAPKLDAQEQVPAPVHQIGAEVEDVDSAAVRWNDAEEPMARTKVVPADPDSLVDVANDEAADGSEADEFETSSEVEEIESNVDQGPVVMIEEGDDIEAQADSEDSLPADEAELVEAENGESTEDCLPVEDPDVAEPRANPEDGGTAEDGALAEASSAQGEVNEIAEDAAPDEAIDSQIVANEGESEGDRDGESADAEELAVSVTTAPKVAEMKATPVVPLAEEMEPTERPAPAPIAGLAMPTDISTPIVPQREAVQPVPLRPQVLPVKSLWSMSNPSVTAAGSGSLRFAGAEPSRGATPEETKAAIRFRSPSLPQANGAPSRISLRPSGTGPTTSVQLVR